MFNVTYTISPITLDSFIDKITLKYYVDVPIHANTLFS